MINAVISAQHPHCRILLPAISNTLLYDLNPGRLAPLLPPQFMVYQQPYIITSNTLLFVPKTSEIINLVRHAETAHNAQERPNELI